MPKPMPIFQGTEKGRSSIACRRPAQCSNLRARCHAVAGPSCLRCTAKVVSLSEEGASLIARLPFERGTILAVRIEPRAGTPLNKLLVVTRLPQPRGGAWLLGGCFVHSLSTKQLEALRTGAED
ncbi:MAG: hypothetical protein K2R98_33160 [Gemmataceae bacterium]|nr:hypothetical protein [Gemmataceae bacterium]